MELLPSAMRATPGRSSRAALTPTTSVSSPMPFSRNMAASWRASATVSAAVVRRGSTNVKWGPCPFA